MCKAAGNITKSGTNFHRAGKHCIRKMAKELADIEEGYLSQKEKLRRLNVGDRNNAYFHRSAQARRMQNSIREVVGPNNDTLTDMDDLKGEAVWFF